MKSKFWFYKTKLEVGYDISCVVAALAAFALLFFMPVVTLVQVLLTVFATISVISIFVVAISNDNYGSLYDEKKFWGWMILACSIIWMFPISIFWSLIPLGLGMIVECLMTEPDGYFMKINIALLILCVLFTCTTDKIDEKRCLLSNPEPETVVLSNYDGGQSVFFIEGSDEHLKLSNFRSNIDAIDLRLTKGDTVQIIRHPNNENWVIKIEK